MEENASNPLKKKWEADYLSLKDKDELPFCNIHVFIDVEFHDDKKTLKEKFQDCTRLLGAIVDQRLTKKCQYMIAKGNPIIRSLKEKCG